MLSLSASSLRAFAPRIAPLCLPQGARGFATVAPPTAHVADTPIGGGYLLTGHRSPAEFNTRILVTGATGQIGSELVPALAKIYGNENVIASDIKTPARHQMPDTPFVYLDVMNADNMAAVCLERRIDWVVHLASLLSAVGERNPQLALKLNTRGIENILNIAANNKLRVFAPSTIAVFGPTTPKDNTPDLTIMRPTTVYGITKVYLELLGEYYHEKFGVDFRSLRYPGIISNATMPGGGTTDYAVEIYHEALKHKFYKCFLKPDTPMPMLYMPDCLDATIGLLNAPAEKLSQRVYNVTGISFTPEDVVASIRRKIPDFEIAYEPDFRQDIADTWPSTIDDSAARKDWDWQHKFDLDAMTDDMLSVLSQRQGS